MPIHVALVFRPSSVMAQIASPSKRNASSPAIHIDPNGNQDSGYAPSNIDDIVTVVPLTPPGSPRVPLATVIVNRAAKSHHQNQNNNNRNGAQRSPKKEPHRYLNWTVYIYIFEMDWRLFSVNYGQMIDRTYLNDPSFRCSVAMRPLSFMRSSVQDALSLARNDSTLSTNSRGSRKDKKNSQATRWVINKSMCGWFFSIGFSVHVLVEK